MLVSREQFFDSKAQIDVRGLTDIQKVARYFILIKNSFGTDLRSFAGGEKIWKIVLNIYQA